MKSIGEVAARFVLPTHVLRYWEAEGLLTPARAGDRRRYTDADLHRVALTKLINRYGRVDLLLVDELGYLQLDRRGAELLFQVLTEREECSAIAIASNEPFSSSWPGPGWHARGQRHSPTHVCVPLLLTD